MAHRLRRLEQARLDLARVDVKVWLVELQRQQAAHVHLLAWRLVALTMGSSTGPRPSSSSSPAGGGGFLPAADTCEGQQLSSLRVRWGLKMKYDNEVVSHRDEWLMLGLVLCDNGGKQFVMGRQTLGGVRYNATGASRQQTNSSREICNCSRTPGELL